MPANSIGPHRSVIDWRAIVCNRLDLTLVWMGMVSVSPLSSVAPLAWLDEVGDGGGELVGGIKHDVGGAVGDGDQGRVREGVVKSFGVGQGEEQVVLGRPCQQDWLVEFLDGR